MNEEILQSVKKQLMLSQLKAKGDKRMEYEIGQKREKNEPSCF